LRAAKRTRKRKNGETFEHLEIRSTHTSQKRERVFAELV